MGNKDEVGARGMLESSMAVALLLMDAETIYNIANLFLAANSPSQAGTLCNVRLATKCVALGGWGWSVGRMMHKRPPAMVYACHAHNHTTRAHMHTLPEGFTRPR